ncbi:contractile injection system tape measure protein [Shewanella sp. YLB-07]|uniref:contractile injection system tape measure protein n=1 Tax=Shewanella sp. YLB-07 TaxID=2601268 RepID=UPI00128BD956|nr:contractile injection system tape measure protein [Shewanella sp. YLB-07]MPY24377.1 hypothetical protein [Shewanella sp. YLB-07]
MPHTFPQLAHKLDTLRIELSVCPDHVDLFSHRCSRLFQRELQGLIERVLTRLDIPGQRCRISSPLVVNLGALPAVAFERAFCQRLEIRLEQLLRPLLSTAHIEPVGCQTTRSLSDNYLLFEQVLLQGKGPLSEPLDEWLQVQWLRDPESSLVTLARLCLNGASAQRLYRSLTPSTLTTLCEAWMPCVSMDEKCYQETLLLSALGYFQQHPQLAMPHAELEWPFSLRTLHQKQLLTLLFKEVSSLHASPSQTMKQWLQVLWRDVRIQTAVLTPLSDAQGKRLITWLGQPAIKVTGEQKLCAFEVKAPALAPLDSFHFERAQRPAATSNLAVMAEDLLTDNAVSCPTFGQREPFIHECAEDKAQRQNPEGKVLKVNSAGLCLLWPFLPSLFRHLGFIQRHAFVTEAAQYQAASCLQRLSHIVQAQEQPPEAIPMLLCGLTHKEQQPGIHVESATNEKLLKWFSALPGLLPSTWQRLSPVDIQQWFLQRPGWLAYEQGDTVIYIEPEPFDVLLNEWPWPTNMIVLPWFERPIKVKWGTPSD